MVTSALFHGTEIEGGQNLQFTIYFHNEGKENLEVVIPQQIEIILAEENNIGKQFSALSLGNERSTILPPGSFCKEEYSLTIPLELQGKYFISLPGVQEAGVVIVVKRMDKESRQIVAAAEQEGAKTESYPVLQSFTGLYQSYAGNFSYHQPIYFLAGTDLENSKFQISFKYRPFDPNSTLVKDHQWLTGLHLGYTQTSFWDLSSKSLPFEDTSYKPQLMYISRNFSRRPSWIDGLYFDSGLQHESNGRDGDDSRGANTIYFRPIAILYDEASRFGFSVSPSIRAYFNMEENNSDLPEYRGYFEVETALGKAHSFMLTTALQFASQGVSFHADLTYPLDRLFSNSLDLFFMVQYTNSLAENLLNYQEREETLRFGFSLAR